VHEAAHAWTALRGGDPTAWRGGQVSLSPWPHIRRSPLGMLVVPLITTFTQGWTMGWATAPSTARGQPATRAAPRSWRPRGPRATSSSRLVALGLLRAGLALGAFDAPAAR